MADPIGQVCLTTEWFGLFAVDEDSAPEPYEWYMWRVIGFVTEVEENGRIALRGIGLHGSKFPEFTNYVFGGDKAKGDLRWLDIYNSAEDQSWPGHKHVTPLVRDIPGFEETFRW